MINDFIIIFINKKMDTRHTRQEKNDLVYSAINSRKLNLELANNIEMEKELEDLIYAGAASDYRKAHELKTFKFCMPKEINDIPSRLYITSGVFLSLLYKLNVLNKGTSIAIIIFFSRFMYNRYLNSYCQKRPEYKEYTNLKKNINKILDIKKSKYSITDIRRSLGLQMKAKIKEDKI